MSGLWTPSGEHDPESGPGPGPARDAGGDADEDGLDGALEEEMARVRAEIASTPAVDIVANHVIGLWNLAVLHLDPEGDQGRRLSEASIAIDAMGGIVDGLGDRLGDHAAPLRDALAQLRLAYVEIQRRSGAGGAEPA